VTRGPISDPVTMDDCMITFDTPTASLRQATYGSRQTAPTPFGAVHSTLLHVSTAPIPLRQSHCHTVCHTVTLAGLCSPCTAPSHDFFHEICTSYLSSSSFSQNSGPFWGWTIQQNLNEECSKIWLNALAIAWFQAERMSLVQS
jgi:hypothetical protein